MMLSQKILACVAAAFLWGVAGTPETGEGRRTEELRQQKQAEASARAAAQQEQQAQREAETRAFLEEMLRSPEREERLVETRRKLQQEIQELEQAHLDLQMQELNLQTELQRQEIDGKRDDVMNLQRELIEIRAQRERNELEMERRRSELNHQEERRDILRMRERLDYVSDWRSVAFDPQEAVMMATQAVVETGLARENPHEAADTLEELLGDIDDLGSRTAIRFALRDLYAELGRLDKAAEHMKQVVRENARALDGMRETERE